MEDIKIRRHFHHGRKGIYIFIGNKAVDSGSRHAVQWVKFREKAHVTDILLITDKPHIQKIFVDLARAYNLPLRVTSALEDGSKELTSAKPSIVFVQAYLSGLSSEIIFTHLKKLLGRRRTRFVLLSPSDKINASAAKLFHACIDISLDEQTLLEKIRSAIDAAAPKKKKNLTSARKSTEKTILPLSHETAQDIPDESPEYPGVENITDTTKISSSEQPSPQSESKDTARDDVSEPSLEEQGVVYAPTPRKATPSEPTETFANPVHEISEEKPNPLLDRETSPENVSSVSPQPRSKLSSFMIWLLPALLVVVAITLLQHYLANPKSTDETLMVSEKTDESTIAITNSQSEKRVNNTPAANDVTQTSSRVQPPTTLPAVIPREGFDASYGNSNPGWERYISKSSEFKVYRGKRKEIKAVQVIDRSNKGIPEAFMSDLLKQLTGSASFVATSTEKEEEYRIQRAKLAGNLSATIYRDAKGDTLRGFVVSWP